MGTFSQLQQQNPMIQQQYTTFARNQSGSNGSKPNWQAFRDYMKQQGQPDPGEQPSDLAQIHQQATATR